MPCHARSDGLEKFLEDLNPYGIQLGLDRMRALLDALGRPQGAFRCVQVAGTNGKGSCCAMLDAILRAAGHRVGLYTSPHLVRVEERIRIDGESISKAAFHEGISRLRDVMERTGIQPTYFEALTAIALERFAASRVEIAILEVGLGGRLDATSAVDAPVSVITRIGLDHTAILGPTLECVAGEKAAVIRPGATAFVSRQPPEAMGVFLRRGEDVGATVMLAGRHFGIQEASAPVVSPAAAGLRGGSPSAGMEPAYALGSEMDALPLPRGNDGEAASAPTEPADLVYEERKMAPFAGGKVVLSLEDGRLAGEGRRPGDAVAGMGGNGCILIPGLRLALKGRHQLDNGEVAVAAARFLSPRVDGGAIRRGLADVFWPGRFQTLDDSPWTVVDGAHNPDGASSLASILRGIGAPHGKPQLVFSALKDKDVTAVATHLFPLADHVHLVQLDNPRAMPLEGLATLARKLKAPFTAHPDVPTAMEAARNMASGMEDGGWVLAAGSLYLVGETLRLFDGSV